MQNGIINNINLIMNKCPPTEYCSFISGDSIPYKGAILTFHQNSHLELETGRLRISRAADTKRVPGGGAGTCRPPPTRGFRGGFGFVLVLKGLIFEGQLRRSEKFRIKLVSGEGRIFLRPLPAKLTVHL